MKEERLKTFEEFWPFYLAEHSKPATRALHAVGTVLGTACLVAALVTWNWYFIPAGLVSGYAFAWVSHFFIEKNRPASFKYPLWSFLADFRMAFRTITFRKI